MAIQEQLNILQKGVSVWNTWRAQNQQIPIDFSEANLNGANLNGANLNGANLNGANLNGANLSNTYLSRANLREVHLSGVIFIGADLSRTDLNGANLSRANLSRANLSEAHLNGANLSRANLSRAHLSRAGLNGADLREVDLSRVDLSGADLREADLSRANLSRANLNGTKLSRANLSYARTNQTIFNDMDLRSVKGLETIQHQGPSGITTSTLERSEGDIPDLFLKRAGLSDTFISYARSLVQSPLQYYTCFISYSSQNQTFVERLYADLQHKGIRCWYAPEDLKIGDHFPERIEEAIRFYDKLIVILSKQSMTSSWVEDEVRAAQEKEERFKQEQQVNKTVLFPIAIDQAIDQATAQWAARLRRQRHIGNFTNWKEHDHYQKAFQRLLRDLQQVPTKDKQD